MSFLSSELFSVVGKTFVVTGGGRGIGAGIANALAVNGAKVVIASRRRKDLERVADAFERGNAAGSILPIVADVSTEAGCSELALAAGQALGGSVNGLISNAGIAWGAPMNTFPDSEWDRAFAVNVKATFSLTRAMLPLLRAGGQAAGCPATVIATGSIVGFTPQPAPTWAYDVSKAALHALTKKLAGELAPHVTVNALVPGFVPSRMSRGLLSYASQEAIAASIPMGRWGSEADMAAAVIYLASRAGSWVTGTTLVVDGGMLAKPLSMGLPLDA